MSEKKESVKRKAPAKEAAQTKSSKGYALLTYKDLALERKSAMRPAAFAVWVRALLQNWRQGTASSKGRAEVSYTTKKPWRQKGTGRARAGSARSPLWRGGGVIFGPQPRTRKLKVPQLVRRRILCDLLYQLADEKRLYMLDFVCEKPQTKRAFQMLQDAGLRKKVIMLVDPKDVVMQASFANISDVQLVFFDQLNAFNVASGKHLVVLKKDFEKFKDTVTQWN